VSLTPCQETEIWPVAAGEPEAFFSAPTASGRAPLRKTNNWFIEFVAGNRTVREATDFTRQSDAAELLKKRMADALGGKIVLAENVADDDLRDLIITDG
jgi:hypothetical protein